MFIGFCHQTLHLHHLLFASSCFWCANPGVAWLFFFNSILFPPLYIFFKWYLSFSQALFDPYFIGLYNVIYTSMPIMCLGSIDQVSLVTSSCLASFVCCLVCGITVIFSVMCMIGSSWAYMGCWASITYTVRLLWRLLAHLLCCFGLLTCLPVYRHVFCDIMLFLSDWFQSLCLQ